MKPHEVEEELASVSWREDKDVRLAAVIPEQDERGRAEVEDEEWSGRVEVDVGDEGVIRIEREAGGHA